MKHMPILQELISAYVENAESHTPAMDAAVDRAARRAAALLMQNATFHSFKPSGKWYATDRGYLSPEVFQITTGTDNRIRQILRDNDGCWPGLSGPGSDFTLVVFGDEEIQHGYPLMIVRESWK